jgi:hypothetical protein
MRVCTLRALAFEAVSNATAVRWGPPSYLCTMETVHSLVAEQTLFGVIDHIASTDATALQIV